ncbi:hypothetical protein FNV64_09755 [Streptomyces sp. S1A1-7]|uniref:hypothetical protein n=1 Tax=Streptomyces sp. S1A1-7 TaxID=2594459 RepID=UPI001162F504|nr:hypothetical protein [Streptomyces sp. S1A1-7]QDN75827.1 hypothetical protein FNV64_09755 [Streptomyces sp. S1A1-7]
MSWSIGGWLLGPFLQSIGPARLQELQERVPAGLKTTFSSGYTQENSLAEPLHPQANLAYTCNATSAKYQAMTG